MASHPPQHKGTDPIDLCSENSKDDDYEDPEVLEQGKKADRASAKAKREPDRQEKCDATKRANEAEREASRKEKERVALAKAEENHNRALAKVKTAELCAANALDAFREQTKNVVEAQAECKLTSQQLETVRAAQETPASTNASSAPTPSAREEGGDADKKHKRANANCAYWSS